MKTLLALAFLAMAGCSVHAGTDNDNNNTSGDYNTKLTLNGCTNEYKAGSLGELCSQLQDDNRDQCGMRYMREQTFKSQCSGDFTPHY